MGVTVSTKTKLTTNRLGSNRARRPTTRLLEVRALGLGLLMLIAGAFASPASALEWALIPEGCAPPSDATPYPCGSLGTYVFGDPLATLRCTPDDSGTASDDDAYPPPRTVKHVEIDPADIDQPLPFPPPIMLPPKAGSARFGATKTGTAMTLPAALVIDWNDAHGTAVTDVVTQVAGDGSRVGFYALDAPELVAELGSSISDAHLLANLCQVHQNVVDGVEPPTVINLSFGRHAPDEFHPDICDRTLACQVSKVIAQLNDSGILITASAGNHRDLLFPAKLEDVKSVGTLDLSHFAIHETATPSWESPDGVDVLLPGDGVCAGGDLAAGSSFASAAAAGYLAADHGNRDGLASGQGLWTPIKGPECYVMATSESATPVCNSGLDAFIVQTLSGQLCPSENADDAGTNDVGTDDGDQSVTGFEVPTVVTVRLSTNATTMPSVPGYPEWQADTHHPSPSGDVCIPCLDPNGGGGGSALRVAGVPLKATIMPLPGADIALNLTGTSGLDDSFHVLSVFLRVKNRFYKAVTSASKAAKLTAGEIDILILQDALDLVHSDEQPSIVFIEGVDVNENGTFEADERFWTSSPVYLP